MAIIKCPECGHTVSDNAQFCPGCGIKIANNIKRCPECGCVSLVSAESCPECGHSYADHTEMPTAETPEPTEASTETEETLAFTQPQSNPPQKKSHTALIVTLVVVLLLAAGAGTFFYFLQSQKQANEEMEAAYAALQQSSEPGDYEAFATQYPKSPYLQDVKRRLARLTAEKDAWVTISLSSSKNDFIQFMNRFPGSKYEQGCLDKIDSLDWVDAQNVATPDAIQRYLLEHPKGRYVAEAKILADNIETLAVQPEERTLIASICSTFFTALAHNDQGGVCSVITPEMTTFLTKPNATKADVIATMEAMHPATITSMSFTVNDDYVITKKIVGEGQIGYNVNYSVDQHIERTDEGKTFASYKVNMEVNPQFKISAIQISEVSSY